MRRLLFFLWLGGCSTVVSGQDFGWWNTTHNWDGVSNWRRYLTLSPAYLGPNALPVPRVANARLEGSTRITLAGEGHFSSGDRTGNGFLEVDQPLFSERVALRVWYIPVEYYHMDATTRDARAARDYDGRGWAGGDVYVGTQIQLLRDARGWPDLLFTTNLKTASGTHLSAARHTNAPAYYFDLSAGKTFPLSRGGNHSVRPHAMVGFYVWQTFKDDYLQNDAFLYGLGADLTLGQIMVTPALGGYSGYLNNGDRPVVARLSLESHRGKMVEYLARLQQGLRDFPYTSVRLGIVLRPFAGPAETPPANREK
ncbi:hypothetical protein GGR26_003018 [Lewinella marina]|nr:hypothetical protein [Neolewinella marina]NJB87238.1 hypothetical protein [Neolewinella marina]